MGVGRGKIDNTFILVKSMNSALTNSKFQPSNDHVQMTSLSKLIFIVIFSLPHFCLYAFLNCFCDTVPCLLSQRLSVHRLVEHEVRLLMKVSQQDQLAQVTESVYAYNPIFPASDIITAHPLRVDANSWITKRSKSESKNHKQLILLLSLTVHWHHTSLAAQSNLVLTRDIEVWRQVVLNHHRLLLIVLVLR